MCFFNRGNTEEINALKMLSLAFVCVCVLFCVNLCQDSFFRFLKMCGLMTCVQFDLETN